MEFNNFIFPAPKSSYEESDFPGELLWVPNLFFMSKPAIPCLFLKSRVRSSKLLIFFHGNAEDIGTAYEMLDVLRTYLRVNVIGVEYPGYGLYPGTPSADQISEDSVCVYDFCTEVLSFNPHDILVFGRSIGSGPSTHLGSAKKIGAVILMAPFTSIRDATRDIVGKYAQYLVADRFRNIDNVQFISSPIFLIHGLLDELIPYQHSQILHENCAGPCHLELPKEMNHNRFDYYDDLLMPLTTFLANCGFNMSETSNKVVQIPPGFHIPPPWQPTPENKGNILTMINNINSNV